MCEHNEDCMRATLCLKKFLLYLINFPHPPHLLYTTIK